MAGTRAFGNDLPFIGFVLAFAENWPMPITARETPARSKTSPIDAFT
jgi:hypothetical protein